MSPTIYNFNGAEVRTVLIESEPWFSANDVCRVLEIKNTSDALAGLDDDEKGIANTDTLGGAQNTLIITESGLYSLVLRSRKPEAKSFRRWITHEVIPSIRKTGSYSNKVALPQNFIEALESNARTFLELAAAERAKEQLALENAELRPKANFFDVVANSTDTVSLNDAAKVAKLGFGRNTLMSCMRADSILIAGNVPAQEYIDRGYFKVIEQSWINAKTGVPGVRLVTRVTQRGIDFLIKKYGMKEAA